MVAPGWSPSLAHTATNDRGRNPGRVRIAFTRTLGVGNWFFRRRAIDQITNDGQGLGSRPPRRQLEQQRQELPVREPQ